MGGILGFLSGPVKTIFDGAEAILSKFVASPEEKLKAQQELLKIQTDFQLALVQADGEFAKQQAAVIQSETNSNSWAARNWRPILMLTFTFIVGWNFVVAPLFHQPRTDIPPDMWELLQLGITGYIIGRSGEKIVPGVVKALKSK